MDSTLTDVLGGIGPRVRRVRQDRGLTLVEVASQTGLSVSTLSRLESGKRRPTLELLIPLAQVLRVALDQLISAPATGDPRVNLTPVRRRRGGVIVPLTQAPGRVKVYKQVMAPSEPALVTHHGHEWLYVLAGPLRLIVGGDERILQAGEIAEFDTGEPHWFGPAGDHAAELLHMTRDDDGL